jgi:hypothetical protein
MNNLNDKQRTLDLFSAPLAIAEHYATAFYDPTSQKSPLEIKVYKSEFKWAKNTQFFNYRTRDFQTNDIILWSFNIEIKTTPPLPLSELNNLMSYLGSSDSSYAPD